MQRRSAVSAVILIKGMGLLSSQGAIAQPAGRTDRIGFLMPELSSALPAPPSKRPSRNWNSSDTPSGAT